MMTVSILHHTVRSRVEKVALAAFFASALYGLTASFALTIEKMHSLASPTYIPSCSINPIISCSNAMNSAQAEVFGIPNSLFGIVAYAVFVAVAGLLLLRVRFKPLIWVLLGIGALAAFLFVIYLIIQSIFFMHVICPWCFGLWVTAPILLVAVVRLSVLHWGDESAGRMRVVLGYLSAHAVQFLVIWYVLLASIIGVVFWEYWASLIPVLG